MQKFLLLILFIFPVHILYGQYEYFNEVYTAIPSNNELSNHSFVTDDGYESYGVVVTDEGFKVMFRSVNFEGVEMDVDTISFDEFWSLFLGYTESITRLQNGDYIWCGTGAGISGTGSMAVRFESETHDKVWELYFPSDTLTVKELLVSKELANGDLIFSGRIFHDVDDDVWDEYASLYMVKTNPIGDTLWTQNLELDDSKFLRVNQVFELPNSDLLLFGSYYHDWDQIIIRLTSEGELLWVYRWGVEELNDWLPYGIDEGNGIFTIAYNEALSIYDEDLGLTNCKPHLRRFDVSDTTVIWDSTYNHEMIGCLVMDIVKTPDQGYAVLGNSYTDMDKHAWILKTDSLGNELWFKIYYYEEPEPGDVYSPFDELYDLEISPDGGFIATGKHLMLEQQSWLLKLDACGEVEGMGCPFTIDIVESNSLEIELSVYPNPVNDILNISFPQNINEILNLKIYNSLGALVYSYELSSGIRQEEVDVSHFSEGIYILQMVNCEGVLVGSEIFEKL